jgi:V8-like Glu-specific endopeptidase
MAIDRFIRLVGLVGCFSTIAVFGTLQTINTAEAQVQRSKLPITVASDTESQATIQSAGFIPKTLKSSALPAKEQTRNVFGRDDRILMTSSDYPWSTIGRVEAPLNDQSMAICTGTLIAKDLVITNAHCIFDEAGNVHPSMSFAPNLINNQTIAKANVVSVVVGTLTPKVHPTRDWAILKLNVPLGKQYGWLEWGTAPVSALKQQQQQFILAGYSGDFPRYGRGSTAGVHLGCSIRGLDSRTGLATHDCDMTRGASGGPIFYLSKQGIGKIVALNSAERINPEGEYPARFSSRTENYAVLTRQWAKAAQVLRTQSR